MYFDDNFLKLTEQLQEGGDFYVSFVLKVYSIVVKHWTKISDLKLAFVYELTWPIMVDLQCCMPYVKPHFKHRAKKVWLNNSRQNMMTDYDDLF